MSRPSIYSEELALAICERMAEGESLRTICKDDDMPCLKTAMLWLSDGKHPEFLQHYVRAREIQADTMAEDILNIADNGLNDSQVDDDGKVFINQDVIARSRLRVDARKWLASKLAPKKYGDKLDLEVTGKDGGPIEYTNTERAARLAAILDRAGKERARQSSEG